MSTWWRGAVMVLFFVAVIVVTQISVNREADRRAAADAQRPIEICMAGNKRAAAIIEYVEEVSVPLPIPAGADPALVEAINVANERQATNLTILREKLAPIDCV